MLITHWNPWRSILWNKIMSLPSCASQPIPILSEELNVIMKLNSWGNKYSFNFECHFVLIKALHYFHSSYMNEYATDTAGNAFFICSRNQVDRVGQHNKKRMQVTRHLHQHYRWPAARNIYPTILSSLQSEASNKKNIRQLLCVLKYSANGEGPR